MSAQLDVKPKHAMIVAAGTGGHVMPGIAVATELRARGWSVSWVGTQTGMENTLVPKAGITLERLSFAGMRGKGLMHALSGGFKLLGAMWSSVRLIRKYRPTVVFGTGGYVCVPTGLMARLMRVPLVLLNSDAAPLMSIKFLAPWADRIAFGFPGAYDFGKRAQWTGNPVRTAVAELDPPEQRGAGRNGPLRVLVVGGSLGAMILNNTVPKALARIAPDERPLVVHQTGERHVDLVRGAYAEAGVEGNVVPFIDDMAGCYAACDVVVCRAGAITVSELCAGGIASILVPLAVSTTSHQVHNAQFMKQAGASVHLRQSELTPEKLADVLMGLTRERTIEMGQQARTLAKPEAARAVADVIEGVAR